MGKQKRISWFFFKHLETQKMFAQNFDEKTENGKTALHFAARTNKIEIAKALIEAGADIDAKDGEIGWTALHRAALNDHLEIGKVLVDAGADLKIETKYSHETALQIAERHHCAYHSGELAEMLRKKIEQLKTKSSHK